MNEPIKADDYLAALHEMRLLVFLECDGSSCEDEPKAQIDGAHFHQVGLTARQFKTVSDAIMLRSRKDPTLKDGYELAEIRFVATVPAGDFDGLSSTV